MTSLLRSWSALLYLGLVASVGGFIVYFYAAQTPEPDHFVVRVYYFSGVRGGDWCRGTRGRALSRELMIYSAVLLTGFAITKLPVEKWLKA